MRGRPDSVSGRSLHAFQKKSPRGVRTARTDIELISRRLKLAQQDHEARYGKAGG
jgi:hypothetical protein